jgi:UDP-3-O-[3-hydroxymyristoyl] glucosamine N-acyltransferase
MQFTLSELQQKVGGEISGEGGVMISGVNALEMAGKGEITFAESARYLEQATKSQASALVVSPDFPQLADRNLLRTDHPRLCFIRIMQLFERQLPVYRGIHPTAVIASEDVEIGMDSAIGEHAVIRAHVRIGHGTRLESGVHVAEGVEIGEDCWIGPNVTLMHDVKLGHRVTIHAGAVIGGEGFGYVWAQGHQQKIPQLGTVRIDDDVEIGCNVCVDRATFGVTRIRRGAKIDNLVQIAHNNDIGEHSILVAQVGLSGSVTLGKRVTLAGQVGVADHVKIGDDATAAARTGVSKNIRPGEVSWGAPNRPIKRVMKELAALSKLPELLGQVRELSQRLTRLEKRCKDPE